MTSAEASSSVAVGSRGSGHVPPALRHPKGILPQALNLQLVLRQKLLALRPREHARRRADGADAACPQRRSVTQAARGVEPLEQADDVARVEGVAAAGAVGIGYRKRPSAQLEPVLHQ